MELTERQKRILYLMVKAHIVSGEPVSSKYLSQALNNEVSSATVRNEMSVLAEQGYLDQPHTSAGRVPTAKAYRMYVNGLLSSEADEATKKTIDNMLEDVSGDFEDISETAGQALSDLTGLPSVTLLSHENTAYVKRLELLPMGRRTVLIVLVTSDTLARSRICKSGFDLSAELLALFDRIASKEIVGTELNKFTAPYMQGIAAAAGNIVLLPFFNTVYDMIKDLRQMKLSLKGEENLITQSRNNADALRLMEFIARRDAIISVLAGADDPVSIVFGENKNTHSPPHSMVVAKHSGGKIGVIGPARMSYDDVIPSIAYFAKKLGEIINKAIKDME